MKRGVALIAGEPPAGKGPKLRAEERTLNYFPGGVVGEHSGLFSLIWTAPCTTATEIALRMLAVIPPGLASVFISVTIVRSCFCGSLRFLHKIFYIFSQQAEQFISCHSQTLSTWLPRQQMNAHLLGT